MRILLYGGLVLLLLIIVTRNTDAVMPARLATPVARNSEGWLIALGVCASLDFLRPRLAQGRRPMATATVIGVALLLAGLALRVAPLPGSVVTLNESLVALGLLVPYLQLTRPVGRRAAILPVIALVAALLSPASAFLTDMAEAVAALVLIPLVVDVIDEGLVAGRAPNRVRSGLGAVLLTSTIVLVHVLTPPHPAGWFEEALYYVQRTNEGWVAAVVVLLYYLTRRSSRRPVDSELTPVAGLR